MSTNILTSAPATQGKIRQSIDYTLNQLVRNGILQYDQDAPGQPWTTRYNAFKEALFDWDNDGSFEAAIKVAFHDMPEHHEMIAQTFGAAFLEGIIKDTEDDHTPHKKRNGRSVIKKSIEALSLDPSKP